MCGIVGYVGEEQAAPILLEGLSKLEYRGYDSAGIAVRNETSGEISIVKAKGRLKVLAEKTDNGRSVHGTCGIGHTRWATHGEPSRFWFRQSLSIFAVNLPEKFHTAALARLFCVRARIFVPLF